MAKVLKDKLLSAGYDVLMIRDGEDVQLDNIARSVIANNAADCHIALHWDSTTSNKGAFYMSVPDVASYKNMEPVKSHWQQHNALGASLVEGLKSAGSEDLFRRFYGNGSGHRPLILTVPSVDIGAGQTRRLIYSQEHLKPVRRWPGSRCKSLFRTVVCNFPHPVREWCSCFAWGM